MNMYDHTVPQLSKMFGNLDKWMAKAEDFAETNELTTEQLLEQRLFPNMYSLREQIEHSIHNATLLVSGLAAIEQPTSTKGDGGWTDMKNRVAEARAFFEQVDAANFADAADRWVDIPKVDGIHIRGGDMFREFSMPNIYFHLTTAYGVMRGLGVPLGKDDYLGALPFVPKG